MKNMLYKEFKLALHPTSIIFLSLSAMVLIPNYPYYVTFFYVMLGVYFMCLKGRENNDITYTMMLPVKKSSVVGARFIIVVILQATQVILAVPLSFLRNSFKSIPANQAGMDANAAMFGIAFIMMGVYNMLFFTKYYKNTDKIGKPFIVASITFFLIMIIAEACTFAIPFVHNHIDNTNSEDIPYRMFILAAGLIIYAVLTFCAYKKSVRTFCAVDL